LSTGYDDADPLGHVHLFSSLKARHRKALFKQGKTETFKTGNPIVKQGDQGIGFYLILDGTAKVQAGGKSIATLEEGDYFGEMAIIDKEPRSADVIAARSTKCWVLSDWAFTGFIKTHPEVVYALLEAQTRRLRAFTHRALVS
jgi:CRP-like cAMP-binding protein